MEKQGALWGARQEVVYRAASALNELMELITAGDLTREPVCLEMMFDEFNLDLTLRYDGKPFPVAEDYAAPATLDDDISLTQLSLCLIRRHVDSMNVSGGDGQSQIVLHFDH